MDWSLIGGGAFIGAMLMKIVDYGIEKKMFEQATEKAEKAIPDYLEKPLGKALDKVADELKDTSNQ